MPATLWVADTPWLHVTPKNAVAPVLESIPPSGVSAVIRMDGTRMTDSDGVFEEFWRQMRFPDYFGWNWDALYDCLRDLNWLPASHYLLVIENASVLLSESVSERDIFFDILKRAADRWASPHQKPGGVGVPFNILLSCEHREVETLRKKLE